MCIQILADHFKWYGARIPYVYLINAQIHQTQGHSVCHIPIKHKHTNTDRTRNVYKDFTFKLNKSYTHTLTLYHLISKSSNVCVCVFYFCWARHFDKILPNVGKLATNTQKTSLTLNLNNHLTIENLTIAKIVADLCSIGSIGCQE